MAIHTQLTRLAPPTIEVNQVKTLTDPSETERYEIHEYSNTAMTAMYGTPFLFCRLKNDGAPPRSERACIARLVAKTAALPVEKTEMKIKALIRDGRTGISSLFIATDQYHHAHMVRGRRTDDVGGFGSSRSTSRNGAKQIRVIGGRINADTKCTCHVEKQNSVNSRVERFWHDASG
jgi:hypothetical protein